MPADLVKIAKQKLTPEENDTLQALTKPGTKIEFLVPKDITYDGWVQTTSLVCRALAKVNIQRERLFPVLGKLLAFARDNPDLWKGKYDKWENFLAGEVYKEWGVERATCFEAMRVVTRFAPLELQIKDYEAIGRIGFKVLNKAIPEKQETHKFAVDLVEMAKQVSVAQLEEFCEEKGYLSHGDTRGGFVRIATNKRIQKRWERFIATPEVQAYCETDRPDKILERMMEECSGEWMVAGEKALAKAGAGD